MTIVWGGYRTGWKEITAQGKEIVDNVLVLENLTHPMSYRICSVIQGFL